MTPPKLWELRAGDALVQLEKLREEGQRFDAFVMDPPYSSGGLFRGDRTADALKKYVNENSRHKYETFGGDNRDQRSFEKFCTMWLMQLLELANPGAVLLTFIDWRQLPTLTDAVQVAGWVWRGIMPWDKTEAARPQRGFYRAQCEYIISATAGGLGREQERGNGVCAPGVFRHAVKAQDKLHPTGKPLELMRSLLSILPANARVLDPFGGSGSTGVAAVQMGLPVTMIEKDPHWCGVIRQRMSDVVPGSHAAAVQAALQF